MLKILPISPVSNVAVLAAALLLQRIHGTEFAARFLQPYGFDDGVVLELLGQDTGDNRG
jgi:hypothetical protein